MHAANELEGTANQRSAPRSWLLPCVVSCLLATLVACGDPPAPAPSPTEATPPADPVAAPPEVPEVPATPPPTEVSAPAPEPVPIDTTELEEARRGFLALLPQLETLPATRAPSPPDCARGCTIENDERLLAVTVRGMEEDGTPTGFEVRVVGREPSVRTVGLEGTDEAWRAYWEEDGPPPWLPALRRAMPTLPASRPASSLTIARAEMSFSLSAYAPLVALGGALEGRYLYWHTARYAHHLYLVHGAEHQMRLVGSLPLSAGACDGDGATTACIPPVGIDGVFSTPGAPGLFLRVERVAAGHGGVAYSSLLVSLADDAALRLDVAQRDREIEASLTAPGARVRPFSIDLIGGEPCDAGCVYFTPDRSFLWAFPERLVDGAAATYAVRGRDGTLSEAFVRPTQAVRDALGEGVGTLGRDIVGRAAVASAGGFAISPVVQLGPPHMGRRLVFEQEADAEVLYWIEGERRAEVARIAHSPSEPAGAWGIDRVYAPEGAGYPLIVVAVAALPRSRAGIEHRVRLLPILRAP